MLLTRRAFLKSTLFIPVLPGLLAGVANAQENDFADTTWLTQMLESVRSKYHVPAMFVALGYEGQIVATACCGQRKIGVDSPVAIEDRVAIGSISKSCGALVVGNLIAQNLLKLDSTIGEVLTKPVGTIHPAYQDATVLQLLKHIAGLPSKIEHIPWGLKAKGPEFRLAWIKNILQAPPAAQKGQFVYGPSYEVLALMCEQVSGQTYEELLARYIFQPCDMASAGMNRAYEDGSPNGRLDQPWGHYLINGKIVPINIMQNTYIFASAGGGISCTISDLCRYGNAMFPGLRNEKTPLGTSAFQILNQALGWGGGHATNGAASGDYSSIIVRHTSAVITIHSTLNASDGGVQANEEFTQRLDEHFKQT